MPEPEAVSSEPEVSIVLPVYNEGANIEGVLRGIDEKVRTRPREILIVYDFEEDDTVPAVRLLQERMPDLRLHRNDLGRGVLKAIQAGFASARAPYLVVMMADGSDEAEVVDAMIEHAVSGADLVAASRYMRGGRQLGGPLLKRTLSRLAGLSLHWLGGVPIHDPTSNFKLYSRRLLEQVVIESEAGFELALELTVKAYCLGLRLEEVPTTWRDRTAGQSRFRLRAWLPHYLRWYWRGMAGRFRVRPRR
ncbi:MAG TPA: glycosyltransferase [Candidatus Dormibacteraeota bacterium]|nr:glycosyltransferase [Candidatus Dormibacteraeota bacterium]